MLACDLRPLPEIIARAMTRRLRYWSPTEPLPTILQWRAPGWDPHGGAPIVEAVGPLHLTLCAHESVRGNILATCGWRGVIFRRDRETWRVTFLFFVFTLTLEWAYRTNFERVNPWEISARQ